MSIARIRSPNNSSIAFLSLSNIWVQTGLYGSSLTVPRFSPIDVSLMTELADFVARGVKHRRNFFHDAVYLSVGKGALHRLEDEAEGERDSSLFLKTVELIEARQ